MSQCNGPVCITCDVSIVAQQLAEVKRPGLSWSYNSESALCLGRYNTLYGSDLLKWGFVEILLRINILPVVESFF